MPTEDAYSSGHLVLSLLGLAFVLLVETSDALYRLDILPVCDIITGLNITVSDISHILVSIEHLQLVWHADRGRLLLSLSCLRTFEFRTSLGTSLLPFEKCSFIQPS